MTHTHTHGHTKTPTQPHTHTNKNAHTHSDLIVGLGVDEELQAPDLDVVEMEEARRKRDVDSKTERNRLDRLRHGPDQVRRG